MNAPVTPFGDAALLVEVGGVPAAHRVAAAVRAELDGGRAPAGVADVVIGFDSVVVHLDRDPDRHGAATAWLVDLVSGIGPGPGPGTAQAPAGEPHQLPVEFDGPDLPGVASRIGTTASGVVDMLTGTELEVAFLGFSPGFPYLIGLPPPLAAVERRPDPRPSVPAGSVAVAGGFASVYPQSTPGGWMLLGRTPVRLFDPGRPPFALLRAGDRVRFRAAPSGSGGARPAVPEPSPPGGRAPPTAVGRRWVEVLRPGPLSLLQDAGRHGVAGLGVPAAGPADPESMVLANRLVGNPDGAAALEITVAGPALRFACDAHCAVVAGGAGTVEIALDAHGCHDGTVIPVVAGQVLDVGRIRGVARAYLAVAGAFDAPPVLGSRSSDVLCGLGPGAVGAGDRLGLGPPCRPHGLLVPAGDPESPSAPVLRVMAGPHAAGDAWDHLVSQPWTVGGRSNRIGVRLTGRRPVPPAGRIPSTGMVTGAVQVPPDGNPIVLLTDHATVGGYPVVGCVVSADLSALGRLGPGDAVRFVPVDLGQALALAARAERVLASRVSGWFPTTAGT